MDMERDDYVDAWFDADIHGEHDGEIGQDDATEL